MNVNKVANRAVMCQVLAAVAESDKDLVVLCSDSRGSGSMTSFADKYPQQFVETGIAEQNLVGIAAGLATCGKKAYVVSPASFLSARSYEQVKVDCAYSATNVKLVGISGGISYGALGMTHHSTQDIAAMTAIPGMRVYIPSDRHQTKRLFETLLEDNATAYVRLGRNAVEDVYTDGNEFVMDRATTVIDGGDVAIIACGEMVYNAVKAAEILHTEGIECSVTDMYCLKPLDTKAIINRAKTARLIVTVEEHALFGGLGSMVSQVVSSNCPTRVMNLALPDMPVITGSSREVFEHYALDGVGIANSIRDLIGKL